MIRFWWASLLTSLVLLAAGCARDGDGHGHEHTAAEEEGHGHAHEDGGGDGRGEEEHGDEEHAHGGEDSWAVTSWGEHFEIFAEADPLVVGQTVNSHTHVTVLRDFSALTEGIVSAILRRSGAEDEIFTMNHALRDGIFDIAITPATEGRFDLLFRVVGAGLREEIPSGEVVVGTAHAPGGSVQTPADGHGDEVSFLKEQQWKTPFATAWAELRTIRDVARGTGLLKPAAGGEMILSASIDGVVLNEPWPYLGLSLSAGETVFSLSSRASQGRSLGELEALETERRNDLGLARERLARLEKLLPVEAVSEADVASARARLRTLEAQHEAAKRELETARGRHRSASTSGKRARVTAPFDGEIGEVLVSPGEAVSAGQALGRMIRVEPVWVEVHIAPEDATLVLQGVVGLWLRPVGASEPTLLESVKLVSLSPQVNARTGRVECLLEISQESRGMRLGSAVEAEVLVAGARSGVVVPSSSVVDDAGTPIIYVQLDGEAFSRQTVDVLGREGSSLLVTGISPGQRIVVKGGASIRRASLVNSGVGHGHAH